MTFRCEAPAAAPFAQLYWLKNGAPITQTDNVQVVNDGSLIIKQATLLVSDGQMIVVSKGANRNLLRH